MPQWAILSPRAVLCALRPPHNFRSYKDNVISIKITNLGILDLQFFIGLSLDDGKGGSGEVESGAKNKSQELCRLFSAFEKD